jgi:hypothetical protein
MLNESRLCWRLYFTTCGTLAALAQAIQDIGRRTPDKSLPARAQLNIKNRMKSTF